MKIVGVLIVAAAALSWQQSVRAESIDEYPSRPVRVIVPTAPGAGTDLQARLLAQKLGESLKHPFIVENRPGAGYVVGYGVVTKSEADGYTLMASSLAISLVPALRPDLPYDPRKDLAPISLVSKAPFLLLVHPSVPVKSVKDLIALARSRPGVLNMGVANGATTHLVSAYFTSLANIKVVLIPYKGSGQVMVDTISGQIEMLFANILASLPHVQSGRLRAIAVSTAERSSVLPDLPTIDESGVKGFDVSTWHAWFAPAGTPPAITRKLSAELSKAVKSPDLNQKLSGDGALPVGSDPDVLRKLLAVEVPRWRKVVKDSGMRVR